LIGVCTGTRKANASTQAICRDFMVIGRSAME